MTNCWLEIRNIVLLLLCCILGGTYLYVHNRTITQLTSADSVIKIFHSQINVCDRPETIWPQMAMPVLYIFTKQNSLKLNFARSLYYRHLVVVLFSPSATTVASNFINSVSMLADDMVHISFLLENTQHEYCCFDKILSTFKQNKNNIRTVVMFPEDLTTAVGLLNAVNATGDLRLTGIIHTAEWIIVSPSSQGNHELQKFQTNVDFITWLLRCNSRVVYVLQKSRGDTLQVKGKVVCVTSFQPGPQCTFQRSRKRVKNTLYTNVSLRNHALAFLRQQKSILSGLHLLSAILPTDIPKLAARKVERNVTTVVGYSAAWLQELASIMDFTYEYVAADDEGNYGVAAQNGSNGLVGLLDRRQAALTTLALSRTVNRLQAVNFIPVVTLQDTIYIIYGYQEPDNDIDLVYVNIVKPDSLLSLLGPALLLGVFGAVVYVATRACTSPIPECISFNGLRYLSSYPENICFHSSGNFPGQTGRVARTTWALFWLIISSAYGAFLVTTFATKPPEAPINTLDKLLAAKDYTVGCLGSATALIHTLQTSKNGSVKDLGRRTIVENNTSHLPLETFTQSHAQKVIDEKYVFLGGFCITLGFCDEVFSNHLHQIRVFPLDLGELSEDSYPGVPKETFYVDDLYRMLLEFEEGGILRYLRQVHLKSKLKANLKAPKLNDGEKAVAFPRIRLPVYATIAGVSVSLLLLILEILYYRGTTWCNGIKT